MTGSEWISCADRLPDPGVEVLFYFAPTGLPHDLCLGRRDENGKTWTDCRSFKAAARYVTHWMELPAPPGQEGGG